MTLLTIKQLEAGYGEFDVLRSVDITIKPGQIVSLIGPNGAGKSTVLKSIYTIADIRSGIITYKDQDITSLPTHELLRLGISYVPQGRINFTTLTVEENLDVGAEGIEGDELIARRKGAVFSRFPVLREKRKELAYSLSGGEQQMLALGRALMQEPALLLLDEPSLGLSPKLVKELFQTIEELKEDGIAILIVEQNAKKAIEISDQTYLLEQGSIALKGGKSLHKHPKIKTVYLGGEIDH